jgi:hypothetical protein
MGMTITIDIERVQARIKELEDRQHHLTHFFDNEIANIKAQIADAKGLLAAAEKWA